MFYLNCSTLFFTKVVKTKQNNQRMKVNGRRKILIFKLFIGPIQSTFSIQIGKIETEKKFTRIFVSVFMWASWNELFFIIYKRNWIWILQMNENKSNLNNKWEIFHGNVIEKVENFQRVPMKTQKKKFCSNEIEFNRSSSKQIN